jgi:hypothetical protein
MADNIPAAALSWTTWGIVLGIGVLAGIGWSILAMVRKVVQTDTSESGAAGGVERLILLLILLPLSGAALWIFAPGPTPVLPPPRPVPLASLSPRTLADHITATAAAAGATAGQRALLASTPTAPHRGMPAILDATARPGTLVLDPVLSRNPAADRSTALRDALEEARGKLVEVLMAQGVPPSRVPDLAQMERDFVRNGSVQDVYPTEADRRAWSEAGLEPNRRWVRVTLIVSPEQLRAMRAEGRATAGLVALGGFIVAIALLAGFLRLDAWSKGYLTLGLALASGMVLLGLLSTGVYLFRSGMVALP